LRRHDPGLRSRASDIGIEEQQYKAGELSQSGKNNAPPDWGWGSGVGSEG